MDQWVLSCVIIPKVEKLDFLCLNGNGGSQNTRKDCRSLWLERRVKISKGGKIPSQDNKKVSTSRSISCSPSKAKYMSLQWMTQENRVDQIQEADR